MRLNRYLAACGLGSRRSCEALVRDGRVRINGAVCRELATRIEPGDRVEVEGSVVRPRAEATVILHKPRGYVTTRRDERGRRTVYDLLPPEWSGLKYVGRLDRESEGLLLLTTSGEVSQRLTHPKHAVDKEYEVQLNRPLREADRRRLLSGVELEEGLARAALVRLLSPRCCRIVIRQGWNRQVRRMFAALSFEVMQLVRVRVGNLHLGELPAGRWRVLGEGEVAALLGEKL